MKDVKFVPAENKVLIRDVAAPKSKSGLIGLEKANEGDATQKAEIFASNALGYDKGEIILYNKFAAIPVKLKEGKFLLASVEAILGKIGE